jgi:hypothetical protein
MVSKKDAENLLYPLGNRLEVAAREAKDKNSSKAQIASFLLAK